MVNEIIISKKICAKNFFFRKFMNSKKPAPDFCSHKKTDTLMKSMYKSNHK